MSDGMGWLASPLEVIVRESDDAALEAIAKLVSTHAIERVVVGMPRSLDGNLGPQAVKVQAFTELLAKKITVAVQYWDERFSTAGANRMMIEADTKKGDKKSKRDAIAAALILQGYLDSKQSQDS